jgi:hypothetical protein
MPCTTGQWVSHTLVKHLAASTSLSPSRFIYNTRQSQPDYQTAGQVSTRAVPVLRLVAPLRVLYMSLPGKFNMVVETE